MTLYKTTMGYINLAGYKLISFDKIPSTQDHAHELVASGQALDHTAVWALAQSAGRGRHRRAWVSHHGNLYVSFIYKAPERDPRLSYAVGVAVAETVASFGIHPTIKWPNDILVDGKKIAGILIEYAGPYVIVGIGINVMSNPTVAEYKTTKMDVYTADVPLRELLARLMRNMDKWMRADFSRVRARWTELAAMLNKRVKYHGEVSELVGINDNGALVLRRDTRYLLVYGDEISM